MNGAKAGASDREGRGESGPRGDAPRASTAWSIPEIRVIKDDQGRLRIDESDPATYGAHTARQFLAIAEADPRYRDGMTKRPSTPSIKLTYVDIIGEPQAIGVREIFCRMDGDALVLSRIEKADGEKVKDLPIGAPELGDQESELDVTDRLLQFALADLSDTPLPPVEVEPEPETARPAPTPGRRLPSGSLRKYDDPVETPPKVETLKAPPPQEPEPRKSTVIPPVTKDTNTKDTKATTGPPAGLTLRALEDGESASLRSLIEAKAGQTRWANGILMQVAERYPSDRKLQNEHLANLLRVSLDPARAESRTPLATALRGVIEEVLSYKPGVLDRDPLKAEKIALQSFARLALGAVTADNGQVKVVSGSSQRTPAQVLAKLEDPKLARATRVKYLLEIVPELIETWRPDKESNRSEAGNENSPMILRKMFAVANEQRQQRRYIDDGSVFRKVGERYAGLESKLPKPSAPSDS